MRETLKIEKTNNSIGRVAWIKISNAPLVEKDVLGDFHFNAKEVYLEQLAREYHKNTESYDRNHPGHFEQEGNARRELSRIKKLALEHGYTINDVENSISNFSEV